jgi:hypothetical protein
MTTGIMFFMTSPGCITPIEAIPTPDFAVPYAAPISEIIKGIDSQFTANGKEAY